MSVSTIERILLSKYRTNPRWGHHGKGIMALDLFVQRSCRCHGNNDDAYLLATKRNHVQESPNFLAVAPTRGLVRCRPATLGVYTTSLRAPRRWKYSVFVEQRNKCFHTDNLRGVLGRLFRLDILAFVWHRSSTSGNFSFHYCTY